MNLGLLFFFKYFNFFDESLAMVLQGLGVMYEPLKLDIVLPVGISFYTFQTLSYTIEVYRGNQTPVRHLGIFGLFVSFFPQLVAGPIERSVNLMPQFFRKYDFDYDRVVGGMQLMLWGFFKKIVVADNLAIVVNQVFNNVHDYNGVHYIIATIFFAFQIFCDFSGYSDIAIGGAQVMGFKLMDNFKRPYFSKSISEFWRRWHISLSSWFRDYVYIPLGGNRVSKARWYYNLMITFLVSGLWHGANWTFVIWGGLHGFYLVFALWTQDIRDRLTKLIRLNRAPFLHRLVQVMITFGLVCLGWIFFRANTVEDAMHIITHLHEGVGSFAKILVFDTLLQFKLYPIYSLIDAWGISIQDLIIIIGGLSFLEFVHYQQRTGSLRKRFKEYPIWVRWGVYYLLIMAIVVFGQYDVQTFIYFQF